MFKPSHMFTATPTAITPHGIQSQATLQSSLRRQDTAASLCSASAGLQAFNALNQRDMIIKLSRVSECDTWVARMVQRAPFASKDTLLAQAAHIWFYECSTEDKVQGFNGRPLIGNMGQVALDLWCSNEDNKTLEVASDQTIIDALLACNPQYEEKFGWVWILFCKDMTPAEQLANFKRRMNSQPILELHENAVEECKILQSRLASVLEGADPFDRASPAFCSADVQRRATRIRNVQVKTISFKL